MMKMKDEWWKMKDEDEGEEGYKPYMPNGS